MINPFIIKRWSALLVSGFLPLILFYIALIYYGFMFALIFFFIGIMMSLIIGGVLLKNPFQAMLEGKGILALSLDSTGIIRPFIVSVLPPYVKGNLNNNQVTDAFDRSSVFNLSAPVKAAKPAKKDTEGGITLKLSEDDYNRARMGFFQYPVLIYNEQVKSFITKDFLSDTEKEAFAEHGILYLNRKMEELTTAVRDFGRHVVESLKPKQNLLFNKWVWVIVLIFMGFLVILFAKPILSAIQGFAGQAGGSFGAIKTAASASAPITPQ